METKEVFAYQLIYEKGLQDEVYTCRNCGEEFVFRALANEEDLENHLGADKAAKLIGYRNLICDRLEELMDEENIPEKLQLCLYLEEVEQTILDHADINSQETYLYHGFEHHPLRCPECRRKAKERDVQKRIQEEKRHRY